MRALALIFLALGVANAFGDAVAGKTHILVEGRQPYWVPIEGGPAAPLATSWGLPVSAAYDGEHFLVVSGAEGPAVIAALYEEGSRQPFRVVTLETQSGGHIPRVVWDGTRYVAAWSRAFDPVRGAVLTPQADVTGYFVVPDFRIVTALASNGTQVLLLEDRLIREPQPRTLTIDAALLTGDLSLAKEFTVSAIPAGPEYVHNQPHLSTAAAVPFANGFSLVESRGDGFGNDQLLATRTDAGGMVVGRTVIDPASAAVFNVELIPSGERLLAILLRAGVHPVTATFISPDGTTIGPRRISRDVDLPGFDAKAVASAVRLPNGALVLVQVRDGLGIVTPLSDAPEGPRRRAVRH